MSDEMVLYKDPDVLARIMSDHIAGGQRLQPNEVRALVNYSVMNQLNPLAGECYYLPGVGPVPGIAGWRRKAYEQLNKEAKAAGIRESVSIWTDEREATHDEGMFSDGDVEKHIEGDVAIHVTLHTSLDKQRWLSQLVSLMNTGMSMPDAERLAGPEPVWTGVGVVFRSESFSYQNKPEKFDRVERATKRAEKIALRKRFQNINLDTEYDETNAPALNIQVETPEQPPKLKASFTGTAQDAIDDLFGSEPQKPVVKPAPEEQVEKKDWHVKDILTGETGVIHMTKKVKPAPEVKAEQIEWTTTLSGIPPMMSLEFASNVVAADGKTTYGSMSIEKLEGMLANLDKSIAITTAPDVLEGLQLRRTAAITILNDRKNRDK